MLQTAQPDPGKEAKSFAVVIWNEMSKIRLNGYQLFSSSFSCWCPQQSVNFKLNIIYANCDGILVGHSFASGASVRNRDHCLREIESEILLDDPGTCSERNEVLFGSNQSTKFF